MLDINQKISEWRKQMTAAAITTPSTLDELESHLRQDIASLLEAGKPEAQAFQLAVARLGSPDSVQGEFAKIGRAQVRPVKIASALWIGAAIATGLFFSTRLWTGKMNLLLYGHVLSVTAGYGAALLIGVFGIYHAWWRRFHALSPLRQKSLDRAVYLFSRVAVGLVIAGMLTGVAFSKQHFGSYWGWDPKETGGLCVIAWLIALAAMQYSGKASGRAAILMCIGSNVIVSLAWFGAGIIDASPAMHGYETVVRVATYWPLTVFIGVNLCLLALGLAPAARSGAAT